MVDVMTGWTDNPDTRGTLDIIFSCLTTVVLCVWSIQHLQIPSKHDGNIYMRKFQWVVLNILAPEFLFVIASSDTLATYRDMSLFRQYSADHPGAMGGWSIEEQSFFEQLLAKDNGIGVKTKALVSHMGKNVLEICRRMAGGSAKDTVKSHEHREPQDELPMSRIGTDSPPSLSPNVIGDEAKVWTITHSAYLNMGGLHIEAEDPIQPGHRWSGSIHINILDPSRGAFKPSQSPLDQLSLSRKEILDKSKGDALTKSLAVLQIMYFVLSIIARKSRGISSSQLEVLTLAFATLAVITYLVLWNKPKGIEVPTTIDLVHFTDDISQAECIMEQLNEKEGGRGNSIDAVIERSDGTNLSYPFLLITVLFGGLHCLAWNFAFPSSIERYVWRVASVSCTSTPFIFIILNVIENAIEKVPRRYSDFVLRGIEYGGIMLLWVYGIARLLLIVISFSSLRSMPMDVYLTTWSKYLPNVQ